ARDGRLLAGDLGVDLAHCLHDRMLDRDFGSFRVVADELHHRRMVLHPRVLGGDLRDLLDQALLDALMVLARNRPERARQHRARREGARIIAGLEAADDAGKRIDSARIERMLYGRYAIVLKVEHRLHDLVAEIDRADAEIALLDAGRLALDVDPEPD